MDGRLRILSHRLLAVLAIGAALLVGGARAHADPTAISPPQLRWPVGGPALATALDLAAAHWGHTPCRGRVAVTWTPLPTTMNANSSWAFAGTDPFARPAQNSECVIALSTLVDWDWEKLCTVVMHEVGHLDGHEHSPDPRDVMYYTYVQPVADCAGTPEPDPTDPVLSSYGAALPATPGADTLRAAPVAAKAPSRKAKRPKAKRPAPSASARHGRKR